jgi:uracil-DNA glycosylase
MTFDTIRQAIVDDPASASLHALGYQPIYVAGPRARIAVIALAPDKKAQESGIAWNDASGPKLFERLGAKEEQFRDPYRNSSM